jgi:hypothetical protein
MSSADGPSTPAVPERSAHWSTASMAALNRVPHEAAGAPMDAVLPARRDPLQALDPQFRCMSSSSVRRREPER